MLKRLAVLSFLLLLLSACTMQGASPPDDPEWRYILSPSGQCYEYLNWFSGYTGYTIAGPVDLPYCLRERRLRAGEPAAPLN